MKPVFATWQNTVVQAVQATKFNVLRWWRPCQSELLSFQHRQCHMESHAKFIHSLSIAYLCFQFTRRCIEVVKTDGMFWGDFNLKALCDIAQSTKAGSALAALRCHMIFKASCAVATEAPESLSEQKALASNRSSVQLPLPFCTLGSTIAISTLRSQPKKSTCRLRLRSLLHVFTKVCRIMYGWSIVCMLIMLQVSFWLNGWQLPFASDLKWPFLEALDGLGYLIPFPLRRPHDFQFGTRLVLPLYDQTTVDKCRRVVEAGAWGWGSRAFKPILTLYMYR